MTKLMENNTKLISGYFIRHVLKQNLQLITNWLLSTYYYLYNIKRPTIIIVYSILVTTDVSQNNRYNK